MSQTRLTIIPLFSIRVRTYDCSPSYDRNWGSQKSSTKGVSIGRTMMGKSSTRTRGSSFGDHRTERGDGIMVKGRTENSRAVEARVRGRVRAKNGGEVD